jgi:hypothetical protein
VWWRLSVGWERNTGLRTVVLGATFVLPLALFAWLRVGPLATGWARRSGTPATVLAKVNKAQPTTQTTTVPNPSSDGDGFGGFDQ